MTVENELILKARNGDDAALTQLVKTYMDFAREYITNNELEIVFDNALVPT